MPKSAKRVKIEAAKAKAPAVPGNTCPSIDYVQEIIEHTKDSLAAYLRFRHSLESPVSANL